MVSLSKTFKKLGMHFIFLRILFAHKRFCIQIACVLLLLFSMVLAASAIEIEYDPQLIEAGRDQQVKITVKLPFGTEGEASVPTLSADRGRLSLLKQVSATDFTALLDVPAQQPPLPGHILLMASALDNNMPVTATGVVTVYSNLKLNGRTTPGAVLFGTSDGELIGKRLRVGDDGVYDLEIPVTPDIHRIGLVVKKGRAKITNPIDIPAGENLWFMVQAFPDELEPGETGSFVNVFVVGENGAPKSAPDLRLECSTGECSKITEIATGLYRARFTASPIFSASRAEIVAYIQDRSRRAEIILQPPPLAALDISADKTTAVPGGIIAITVRTQDTLGNPYHGAAVDIFADGEFAGRAKERDDGTYSLKYVLPTDAPDGSIGFSASVPSGPGRGEIIESKTAFVEVIPPAVELSVVEAPAEVSPGQKVMFTVEAETETGVIETDITLIATPDTGEIGPPQAAGSRFRFEYTAPDKWDGGRIGIEFSVPDRPDIEPVRAIVKWKQVETLAEMPGTSIKSEDTPAAESGATGQSAGEESSPTSVPAALSVTASAQDVYPGDTITLTATIADETGAGISGFDVVFTADTGVAGTAVDAGGGRYTSSLSFPPDSEPGIVNITAICECGGKNLSAPATVRLLPLPPASVELSAFQQEVYLGAQDEVRVTVAVLDRFGNGVSGADVVITAKQDGKTRQETVTTDSAGAAETVVEILWPEGDIEIEAVPLDSQGVGGTLTIIKKRYDISRIELTAASSETRADGQSRVEFEALAIDTGGNDAYGERIDFVLKNGSGRLTETDCETDEEGRCSVYYVAGSACGQVEVEAYVYRDDTIRTTSSITETPAIPASLTLNNTPARLTANGRDTATIQMLVKDAGDCPVANEVVDLNVSSGPGTVVGTATTDSAGLAAAVFSAGLTDGSATVIAAPRTSPMVVLTVDVELDPWTPASFDVSASQTDISAGQNVELTITAIDSEGYSVTTYDAAGKSFAFSGVSDSPDGTQPLYPSQTSVADTFTAGAGGVAVVQVAMYKAETAAVTVTEAVDGITGTSQQITVSDAGPYGISITSGGTESVTMAADGASTAQVDISLVDEYGNPVSGASLVIQVTQGGGSVSPSTVTTDSIGAATAEYTAGLSCGTGKVGVWPQSNTSVADELVITHTAAVPSTLTAGSPSYSVSADNSSTIPVEVVAVDAGGCEVVGETINFTVVPAAGAGSVAASAQTGSNGVASAVYTAGGDAGTFTINAVSNTAPGVSTSISVTQIASVATQFRVEPGSYSQVAGVQFTITVTALDANSNVVTSYDPGASALELLGASDAPDSTPPSAVDGTFVDGVATIQVTLFKDETITPGVRYGTIVGYAGSPVDVAHAAPSTILFTTGGADETTIDADGGATQLPLSAVVNDDYGNSISGMSVSFETDTPADGSVSPATADTDASGTAVSLYTSGSACGDTTLTAYPQAYPALTDTIIVHETAAVVASITDTGGPYSVSADGVSSVAISVRTDDAGGCPVENETVNFSVTPAGGAGSVAATAVTNSSGIATVSYTAGTYGGSFNVVAESDSVPSVNTNITIQQTASVATGFNVVPDSYSQTAGSVFTVTITAIDGGGATVAGYDPGASALELLGASDAPDSTSPSAVGGAFTNGVSTADVTLYKVESVAIGVRYGTIEGYTTSNISVEAGSPAAVSITSLSLDEITIDADGATTAPVSVETVDDYGNNAQAGIEITFDLAPPGDGGVSPATADTDASGVAATTYTAGTACGDSTVTAYPTAFPAVSDSLLIHETAALPATINQTGGALSVDADGSSTVNVQVRILDAGDCSIAGETVDFSVQTAAGAGTVDASDVSDGSGNATAQYTAGTGAGNYTVTAVSNSVPTVSKDITITQNALTATYFTVVPTTGYAQTAGVVFDVVVTAKNNLGNTVADYDPGATTVSFSGANAAPDTTAPSIVDNSFVSGVATDQVTLYEANSSVDLTIGYGTLEGTSNSINVSAGAAAAISKVEGDGQTAAVSTEVATVPTVRVVDDYGNPVSGVSVTFTATAGGGSVTDGVQTTGANGQVAPGAWELGATPGTNTLHADAGGSLTVDFTATAVAVQNITAVITLESGSTDICPGGSVDFTAASSYPNSGYNLTHWFWNFGNGHEINTVDPSPETFNVANTYNITLIVYDDSIDSDTAATTVRVSNNYRETILQASPDKLDADGADFATIRSQEILDCTGSAIPDGTSYTLSTTLGTIVDGPIVLSSDGVIQFQLQSGTTPGTAEVTAVSTTGLLSEDTVYVDIGVDTEMPFVTEFSPAGKVSSNFSEIEIVFSEDVDLAPSPNSSFFSVTDGGVPVAGTWTYDDSSYTAAFEPDTSPYSVSATTITVTASQSIADKASPANYLDGEYSGSAADFTFQFGGAITDTTKPTVDCTSPGYGPDISPFNPSEESTTITFEIADDTALSSWKMEIKKDDTLYRSYAGASDPASPQTISQAWDGRDEDGNVVEDDNYHFRIYAVDSSYNYSNQCQGTVQVQNEIEFGTPFP